MQLFLFLLFRLETEERKKPSSNALLRACGKKAQPAKLCRVSPLLRSEVKKFSTVRNETTKGSYISIIRKWGVFQRPYGGCFSVFVGGVSAWISFSSGEFVDK